MKKIQKFVMALLAGMAMLCTQLEVVYRAHRAGASRLTACLPGLVQSIKNRIISYAGNGSTTFYHLKAKTAKTAEGDEDGKMQDDAFIGEDGNCILRPEYRCTCRKDGLIPQVADGKDGIPNGSLSGDRMTPSGSAYRLWRIKTACRLMRSGLKVSAGLDDPEASGSVAMDKRRLRTFTTF